MKQRYYKSYCSAEGVLRQMRMSQQLPGFEYLKIAVAISKEDEITDIKKLIDMVEKETMKISCREIAEKKEIKQHDRGMVEQSMLEAIRSVSTTQRKVSIGDFIDFVVSMI